VLYSKLLGKHVYCPIRDDLMSIGSKDEVRFTTSQLELREIVTLAGDHRPRWEQVFEVLNEALHESGDESNTDEMRAVRAGLDRRTN
jgi:hypothetical protein